VARVGRGSIVVRRSRRAHCPRRRHRRRHLRRRYLRVIVDLVEEIAETTRNDHDRGRRANDDVRAHRDIIEIARDRQHRRIEIEIKEIIVTNEVSECFEKCSFRGRNERAVLSCRFQLLLAAQS